nr:hypothetical protein [Mycobacterium leprae]
MLTARDYPLNTYLVHSPALLDKQVEHIITDPVLRRSQRGGGR